MKNSYGRSFRGVRNLRAHGRWAQLALLVSASAAPLLLANTAQAATMVACIGEQTTKTTDGGVTADKLWPAQLGMLLGNTYQVDNDVMNNGNTVTSGNCVTAASKNPVPAIVVIGPFTEHDYAAGITEPQWQASYAAVVKQYLDLVPSPDVYVMTPPPAAFVYQSAAEQTFATDVVKPAVLAVAAANPSKVHVVDLFGDAKLVPGAGDGHFTIPQYVEVATLAYNAIKGGGAGGGGSGGTGGTGGAAGSAGAATGGTAGSSGAATGGTGGTAGATTTGGVAAGGVAAGGVAAGGVTAGGVTSGGSGTTLAGTGGSGTTLPTAGSATAGTGTAAPTSSATSNDSGGCSFEGSGSKGAGASWLVLLGALLVQRRRRRA